jgi:hypothetical protein
MRGKSKNSHEEKREDDKGFYDFIVPVFPPSGS